jgi:glutamate-1-semialdehyde 2,1-aminomutase
MTEPIRWNRSQEFFERSKKSLAGGASSPFRASVQPVLFFQDGDGPRLKDVDGNWYIDHVLAWGPLILGHRHPSIVQAVREAAELPHNYGAQHEREFLVAEQLCSLIPCAETVALTSSGSEAVQLAFRLARAFTGRSLIVKFEGHYHGWMDSTLLSYHPPKSEVGPVESPRTVLGSQGQAVNVVDNVIVLAWNDLDSVRRVFAAQGDQIAAVITEPILCNSGCLMPDEGYLEELRRLTTEHKALLIFDEVITGFRIALGGAQSVLGVTPDIATFGKAVAGGLPLSVIAGRREILNQIADGRVVFGGTFNGNCLSLAGAHATLSELSRDNGRPLHDAMRSGEQLMNGIEAAGRRLGVPIRATGFGTAFSVHFTELPVLRTYRDTLEDNEVFLRAWHAECLIEGVFLMPGGRVYTSTVHSPEVIGRTLEAWEHALKRTLEKQATHAGAAR